ARLPLRLPPRQRRLPLGVPPRLDALPRVDAAARGRRGPRLLRSPPLSRPPHRRAAGQRVRPQADVLARPLIRPGRKPGRTGSGRGAVAPPALSFGDRRPPPPWVLNAAVGGPRSDRPHRPTVWVMVM